MKPFFCALLLTCLTGCEYRSSATRSSSPLRATIGQSSSSAKLRAAILAIIPLGSPRQTVEERIKANFDGDIRTDTVSTNAPKKLHPGAARIEIKVSEHGAFGGKEETYARFVFDHSAKLEDVTIYTLGSWL